MFKRNQGLSLCMRLKNYQQIGGGTINYCYSTDLKSKVLTVYMFTGQGSQHSRMFSDIDSIHPLMKTKTCQSIFFNGTESDEEIMNSFRDFSFPVLRNLNVENIENPPTSLAQPLILIQSILLFERYRELLSKTSRNEEIACMLGHSLGEFTALAACGGVSIEEAIKLVNVRGKSMERNITKEQETDMGMRAIINIPLQLMSDIEKYFTSTNQKESLCPCCDMANINTPQQVVLSGLKSDMDRQISMWQENYKCKLRAIPLNVHLPFHSKYLEPVSIDISNAYDEIDTGNIVRKLQHPIVANTNAKFVNTFAEIKALSIHQVHKPVLWNMSIQSIIEHVRREYHTKDTTPTTLRFIEFGPQKKLEPMISKCCSGGNGLNIESLSFNTLSDVNNYFQ